MCHTCQFSLPVGQRETFALLELKANAVAHQRREARRLYTGWVGVKSRSLYVFVYASLSLPLSLYILIYTHSSRPTQSRTSAVRPAG